jgi:hypothetical protein
MWHISHSVLKELLDYNPKTGLFHWIVARPKVKVGAIAGSFRHRKGYVIIEIYSQGYAAHRLAWFYMTSNWPIDQIDHINGNRSDNRFENLREANASQNRWNRKGANKTGFKGVRKHPWLKYKPYEAQIQINGKVTSLGCFPTAEEAHEEYKKAAIKYHGDFARF